jgi:hypothetical protein
MKKIMVAAAVIGILLCSCPGYADEKSSPRGELGIATGQEQGTYYAMARDLKKLAARHGIELNVIPSFGSADNLLKVYQFPSIQLGMVQLDTLAIAVLTAVAGKDDISAELGQLLQHTQVVLPLYREEVHLVASADIKGIEDLKNKKISIGKGASGTFGTAQVIMREYQIEPSEVFTMDTEQSIEALRRGKIDAFFAVAGAPAEVFRKQITADDKFRLLAINRKESSSYDKATIPANTYGWQAEAVATLSTLNVLITSDRSTTGGECQNIGRFARMVYDNLGWLKENGHPKWKDVSIDKEFLLKDKIVSPCVSKAWDQKN